MTSPRIASRNNDDKDVLIIKGAKNIPDNVKADLIPLRRRLRLDLIMFLREVIQYLSTSNGNKEKLKSKAKSLLHLIELKGDQNVSRRSNSRTPASGTVTKSSRERIMGGSIGERF